MIKTNERKEKLKGVMSSDEKGNLVKFSITTSEHLFKKLNDLEKILDSIPKEIEKGLFPGSYSINKTEINHRFSANSKEVISIMCEFYCNSPITLKLPNGFIDLKIDVGGTLFNNINFKYKDVVYSFYYYDEAKQK